MSLSGEHIFDINLNKVNSGPKRGFTDTESFLQTSKNLKSLHYVLKSTNIMKVKVRVYV